MLCENSYIKDSVIVSYPCTKRATMTVSDGKRILYMCPWCAEELEGFGLSIDNLEDWGYKNEIKELP